MEKKGSSNNSNNQKRLKQEQPPQGGGGESSSGSSGSKPPLLLSKPRGFQIGIKNNVGGFTSSGGVRVGVGGSGSSMNLGNPHRGVNEVGRGQEQGRQPSGNLGQGNGSGLRPNEGLRGGAGSTTNSCGGNPSGSVGNNRRSEAEPGEVLDLSLDSSSSNSDIYSTCPSSDEEEAQFPCTICSTTWRSYLQLQSHKRFAHMMVYICLVCKDEGKSKEQHTFEKKGQIEPHFKQYHPRIKRLDRMSHIEEVPLRVALNLEERKPTVDSNLASNQASAAEGQSSATTGNSKVTSGSNSRHDLFAGSVANINAILNPVHPEQEQQPTRGSSVTTLTPPQVSPSSTQSSQCPVQQQQQSPSSNAEDLTEFENTIARLKAELEEVETKLKCKESENSRQTDQINSIKDEHRKAEEDGNKVSSYIHEDMQKLEQMENRLSDFSAKLLEEQGTTSVFEILGKLPNAAHDKYYQDRLAYHQQENAKKELKITRTGEEILSVQRQTKEFEDRASEIKEKCEQLQDEINDKSAELNRLNLITKPLFHPHKKYRKVGQFSKSPFTPHAHHSNTHSPFNSYQRRLFGRGSPNFRGSSHPTGTLPNGRRDLGRQRPNINDYRRGANGGSEPESPSRPNPGNFYYTHQNQ